MEKVISTTEARQGRRVRMTTRILVVSTLLAFVVLIGLYFVYWPWPEPNSQTVQQPGVTDRAPEAVQPPTEPKQPAPQQ